MIDDATALQIVHGSPAGYELGCRSRGGCANHGHPTIMTCADAYAAARADWKIGRLPKDQPVTKSARKLARPTPRTPSRPQPAAAASGSVTVPDSPARKNAHSKPRTRRNGPASLPSTSPTRSGSLRGGAGAARVDQPIKHGTVWGYARGCRKVEDCPNHAKGLPSCTEEHRRYGREYAARRRRGEGPEITHGTTTGYAMGCHVRTECPGDVDGLTCSDAQREHEERRRRARGVQPRPELTDSQPSREHVQRLREAQMSIRHIAETAQVSKTAIRMLLHGRDDYVNGQRGPRHGQIPAQITVEKANRILAVPAPLTLVAGR